MFTVCRVLCWVLLGLGKVRSGEHPPSPWRRGRHMDGEARHSVAGVLAMPQVLEL